MSSMKTYILHATVHWTVQSRETGQTESGTQRPTLSVRASSEKAAINKARKERKDAIGTEYWPCIGLSLSVEHVTVV